VIGVSGSGIGRSKQPFHCFLGNSHLCRDDHYYQLQSERSRVQHEKAALEKAHEALLEAHHSLQSQLDDALSERDDAFGRAREALQQADTRKSDKVDVIMKAEIDRLRAELYVILPFLENIFIVLTLIQTKERGESCYYRVRA
jgi:protein HOOK3